MTCEIFESTESFAMKPAQKARAENTVRTFIALELAPEIKQAIAAYLLPLRKFADGISWVKNENLHLTLKFLGETPGIQIPELAKIFEEICSRYEPMRALVSGSGVFPNEKSPRVLWLGLQTESDSLNRLAKEIDAACTRFGFKTEVRPFAPHLTIGRVREGKAAEVIKTLRERPFPSKEINFQECTLMKSELHSPGSIHTPLQKFAFRVISK